MEAWAEETKQEQGAGREESLKVFHAVGYAEVFWRTLLLPRSTSLQLNGC
jgi:hypothetical protein